MFSIMQWKQWKNTSYYQLHQHDKIDLETYFLVVFKNMPTQTRKLIARMFVLFRALWPYFMSHSVFVPSPLFFLKQDIADPFFAYCKQHADRLDRKWKRKNYLALQSYCKMSLQEREKQLSPEAQVLYMWHQCLCINYPC